MPISCTFAAYEEGDKSRLARFPSKFPLAFCCLRTRFRCSCQHVSRPSCKQSSSFNETVRLQPHHLSSPASPPHSLRSHHKASRQRRSRSSGWSVTGPAKGERDNNRACFPMQDHGQSRRGDTGSVMVRRPLAAMYMIPTTPPRPWHTLTQR